MIGIPAPSIGAGFSRSSDMQEFPKVLYGKGWDDISDFVVVIDEDEEKKARDSGYAALNEARPTYNRETRQQTTRSSRK
jgi:hypothetical protein